MLAVAVLPMLGIGGMQLYRAEMPGPVKDAKLTPRIAETAKVLWLIYVLLTLACAIAYWFAGMDYFDAISHAFSTVATGGFSTHDNSIGHFDNAAIESVAMVFMLLGAINFGLHFVALRKLSFGHYRHDSELRTYIAVLLIAGALCVASLVFHGDSPDFPKAVRDGLFQTVSAATSTGYTTTAFWNWSGFVPLLIIFLSTMGGCAASTCGGLKVVRCLLLFKQAKREFLRLLHPSVAASIKIGGRPLAPRVIDAVWGFFAVYSILFVLIWILLMGSGLDITTAFSATAAGLNNLGPGLSEVGSNYVSINDFAKWVMCFAMLLGRLELFTLLVLFTPYFWRR